MRAAWKLGAVGLVFGYFGACAPVQFDSLPEPSCGEDVSCFKQCTGDNCVRTYTVTRTVGETPVDILIVNDNSGSMSPIQEKFANAFSGFLDKLDSAGLDYRIAMTTTDISNNQEYGSQRFGFEPVSLHNGPSQYNGYGALQDGNLIEFAPGKKFLTKLDANRENLFISAVQRPETLYCEQSGYDEKKCPSNDERGIFALNLVIDRTAHEFMRDSSAVAVIILANEDERGYSHLHPGRTEDFARTYPTTPYDRPEIFVERFRSKYPGKTLAVHSIIVKPGDTTCRNQASEPGKMIIAKEGYAYADLSQRTGGIVGSICEWTHGGYTAQLEAIGDDIQKQVLALPFSCRPDGDQYTVTVDPVQPVTWTPNWQTMQLTSDQPLAPGTTVKLTYSCSLN